MANPLSGVNLRNLFNLRLGGTTRLVNQARGPKGRKAVDQTVRKLAFDVGARLVKSLNGIYDAPKRIDTGRYRASWAVGTTEATGIKIRGGVTRDEQGRFQSDVSSEASRHDDGKGSFQRTGPYVALATVTSNVEYGPYIEFGAEAMEPGFHRDKALKFVQREAEAVVALILRNTWL